MKTPIYNPKISYDDNYKNGPFGAFADGKVYEQKGEPLVEFLGQKVYLPFGIPAGPLLNSKFTKAAFEKGFDLVVYKTVRSGVFPCHPTPNVLPLHIEGDLTLEKAKSPLTIAEDYSEPLSITNSFGVPSKDPHVWQEDAKKAISYASRGQALILSFMGTVREGQTEKEFVQDFADAAKQSIHTGAKILEVNLSCPNIGNEGLVCYNIAQSTKVLAAIRNVIGNTPLIVKVGYFQDDRELGKIAEAVGEYANGIAAINTIAAPVVDKTGKQALPGSPVRLKSGICGASIKWAGVEMVTRLQKIRDKKKLNFTIVGVGGVTKSEDYFEYIKSGADAVMSATGAMWNPYLAQEIKAK